MNDSTLSTSPNAGDSGHDGTRTIDLLRQIQSGAIDAKSVSVEQRRHLVSALVCDGYSTSEMAEILVVADRTIERYRRALRETNLLSCDPEFPRRMAGQLLTEAELTMQRIRKAARDRSVPAAVKIDGEHRCFLVMSELVRSLQRLGFLPTAANKLEADLTHHVGEVLDFAAQREEVRRLRQIAAESSAGDSRAVQELAGLERDIVEADMATRVGALTASVEPCEENNNERTQCL